MPFIGNQPTAIPLASSDLEDNIISTAKIQDNAVTAAKYVEPIPFRNIIINGDMSIAQRATSTASITSTGYHTVDRWKHQFLGGCGTWTISQDTDVPSGQGFAKSLKLDCTTAKGTPDSNTRFLFSHLIEGQNLQYLKKGTSSAESLTASFWVKSNKTGTYILAIYDADNDRQIAKSYTIDSASTWEKKIITFEGDTTGTLGNDNNASFQFNFWLAAGSNYSSGTLQTSWGSRVDANRAVGQVNLADSTSNEWYITGVQLEAGTSASDFEFLPVDVNLQRCQRYYYLHASGNNQNINMSAYYTSSYLVGNIDFPVEMRSAPSLVHSTGSNYYRLFRNGTTDDFNNFSEGLARPTKNSASLETALNISGTAGEAGISTTLNASAFIAMQSEL